MTSASSPAPSVPGAPPCTPRSAVIPWGDCRGQVVRKLTYIILREGCRWSRTEAGKNLSLEIHWEIIHILTDKSYSFQTTMICNVWIFLLATPEFLQHRAKSHLECQVSLPGDIFTSEAWCAPVLQSHIHGAYGPAYLRNHYGYQASARGSQHHIPPNREWKPCSHRGQKNFDGYVATQRYKIKVGVLINDPPSRWMLRRPCVSARATTQTRCRTGLDPGPSTSCQAAFLH